MLLTVLPGCSALPSIVDPMGRFNTAFVVQQVMQLRACGSHSCAEQVVANGQTSCYFGRDVWRHADHAHCPIPSTVHFVSSNIGASHIHL